MKLSSYSDYAFRVLIFVGYSEGTTTVGRISESFDISNDHLKKVVNQLVRCDYLISTRGRHGGIRLACDPQEIQLGDVVEKFENLNLVECFDKSSNTCPIDGMCSLKGLIKEAQKSFVSSLNRHSLADLMKSKKLRKFCQNS